jgi:hypothetical protein
MERLSPYKGGNRVVPVPAMAFRCKEAAQMPLSNSREVGQRLVPVWNSPSPRRRRRP